MSGVHSLVPHLSVQADHFIYLETSPIRTALFGGQSSLSGSQLLTLPRAKVLTLIESPLTGRYQVRHAQIDTDLPARRC